MSNHTEIHTEMCEEIHDHDRGLAFDLARLPAVAMNRRGVLRLFGGAGAPVALAACGASATTSSPAASTVGTTTTTGATATTASTATTATTAAMTGEVIPEETAGPYPGDGTNGPNVLDDDGIVRRDITSSFGTSTTKADGIPATVVLTLVSAATGAPLPGASVYLWHCDRDGRYSIYDDELTDENYLRGVQQAGDDGVVTFTTIFPGCYDGRWPHMHFEVFSDLTTAVNGDGAIATSQLALVQSVCEEVYATTGYEQSATNLGRVSLTSDNIFSDGADQQTPATTGSVSAGYTMALTVPVEV
jgi:protocatechuate 3,4-dioxygenase beta subunit